MRKLDELRRLYSHYSQKGVRFVGRYEKWEAASEMASGYSDQEVLQRAIESNQKVQSGQATYERDGVAFTDRAYPYPLLAALLRTASSECGLSVLDFGGGLASTYFQCLPFFPADMQFCWSVVEQQHFASWGQSNLGGERLRFFDTVERAVMAHPPNVALFSGVLQYIPNPVDVIRQLILIDSIQSIIIDRTPLLDDPAQSTQLVVQEVPASIVESSYPAWLFSKSDLLVPFHDAGFEVFANWDALDAPMGGWGRKVVFKGFALERKKHDECIFQVDGFGTHDSLGHPGDEDRD